MTGLSEKPVHQQVASTGSQYLGSELDWLGEGKLRWWSWDRDGLG